MQPTVKGTSLLLLQKIEMSPFVTYSDLAFARKELPEGKKTRVGTCLALKFTGQTAELCLHLPVQADLAYSPSKAGRHKINMTARQEKKNSPLCLVNPKRPIGLK